MIKKVIRYFLVCFAGLVIAAPVIITVLGSFISREAMQLHFGGLFDYTAAWSALTVGEFADEISLEQYKTILIQSPDYLFRFWRSLWLTVPIIIGQLCLSGLAAYAFSQSKKRIMSLIFFLYLFLLLLPSQVTVIPNYLMAKQLNMTDTDWSIWLSGITSPFSVYLLTRSMNRIPSEILEAGRCDGATEKRILFSIVIPICKGQITVCAILLFAEYWNMVELPIIMFSNVLSYPLSVYLSRIQEEDIGIAFAASVIYMIPAIFVFMYGEEDLLQLEVKQ